MVIISQRSGMRIILGTNGEKLLIAALEKEGSDAAKKLISDIKG